MTPGNANVTVSRSFAADFENYVNATNQMRIRFLSNGATARTLRIDGIRWSMTALGAGGAMYVDLGASQSGGLMTMTFQSQHPVLQHARLASSALRMRAAGPNGISANPAFIQTSVPTLPTYYRPAAGSLMHRSRNKCRAAIQRISARYRRSRELTPTLS